MRTAVIFAAVCICLAAATETVSPIIADETYISRQKSIYQLYWHIEQSTLVLSDLHQKAKSYNIADHLDSYTDPEIVQHFLAYWNHGMLPPGELFSTFYPQHVEEAHALFDILYHAKDFKTFIDTAIWARFNVNEMLFTYALTVAVIHRPDTKFIRPPPMYETLPHLFFNNEVIQQVYRIKMGDVSGSKPGVVIKHHESGLNDVVIHANYSGWYMSHDHHSEEKLTYFTEDIGLSSFHFYVMNEFPFWMTSIEIHGNKHIRGEMYYHAHRQLLARYYSERLSNGLGEIEDIDWHEPILPGFHPTIFHSNGLPFHHRSSGEHIPSSKYKYVHDVEDIETRISMAIDAGYIFDDQLHPVDIYTPEGFNLLANAIQGNADSINYQFYNSLDHVCKKILGFNLEPVNKYQIIPSALEYSVTSVRDPVFYRIYKKILGYFIKYKSHLPKYTHEHLVFPGVKVDSVVVDKLITYFDHFDSEISNALPIKNREETGQWLINVRQHRLNHKPFNVHITVNSDKAVKGVVRLFLGPKYDVHGLEVDMIENWMNYFQLDQWVVDLVPGINKIEYNDRHAHYSVPDEVSGHLIWDKIIKAEHGEQFTYEKRMPTFPTRLILPKGKTDGMAFKLFVAVSPFDETKSHMIESPIFGSYRLDGESMGYPFDRPTYTYFNVPNMFWKDVMIYHKHTEELNLTV